MDRRHSSEDETAPWRPGVRTLGTLFPLQIPTPRQLLTLAAVAGLYFVAAKIGLIFAFLHPSATPIWPPAGIALAAFLVLGLDMWPAILLGAFLANLTTHGNIETSLLIGVGNTLEGVVGAMLVRRFAHGRHFFAHPKDVAKFALLAAVLSTTVSATIGLTSLALFGFAPWGDYGHIWLTWWLGDAAGDLVVAPPLILWSSAPRQPPNRRWLTEAGAALASLGLMALAVFHGLIPDERIARLPVEFLCVPFLFWAAFRLGRRWVAICVLVLAVIAIDGTLRGLGPFAREGPNDALLLLQGYLAVTAVTMLAAAAVVREYREAEEQLRRQAVRDELTGLANYRFLMSTLESEVRRAQRTGHAFSALLLDLDGLKQINDRFGHLMGNRALCRLGECLRGACRVTDTAARFGGDEFALVLPETPEAGARQLAERIAERLASGEEQPRLSVSIGVAVYPRDGATADKLLSAADQELYRAKEISRTRGALTGKAPR